jgi:predicted CXXCH cytochrome family protein
MRYSGGGRIEKKAAVLGMMIILVFASWAWAAPPVNITFPLDKAAVDKSLIGVFGTAAPGTATVNIDVSNGNVVGSGRNIPVVNGGFTARVELDTGQCTIKVSSPQGSQSITVYRLSSAKEAAPKGMKRYYLHRYLPETNQCIECHDVSATKTDYRKMRIGKIACTTNSCHPKFVKDKFVHGPAASAGGSTCISCHNPHGSFNKTEISRAGAEMCYVCHDDKRAQMQQAVQHFPVAQGDCVACHDPHQSPYKFQLKGNADQLCYLCHERNKADKKYVHGPVGAGDCNVCHNPHASPFKFQLSGKGSDVCFSCHEDRKAEFNRKHVHKPAAESCTLCHDPHTGPGKFVLKDEPPKLCYKCHQKVEKDFKAAVIHKPAATGECAKCHTPHASDYPRQLQKPGTDLCYLCHTAQRDQVKNAKHKHGPVVQGDCAACHNPHGAPNPLLMRKYFPREFYNAYSTDKYALCFECHNKDIALSQRTTTLTSFRDGDLNLHFLHVNKPRNGRSCKACHEAHASNQDKHIRIEVPFGSGGYSYPILFTKTSSGGTCVVGCHANKTYKR